MAKSLAQGRLKQASGWILGLAMISSLRWL